MLEISWFICGALFFFLYSYLFCTLVCKKKFKMDLKNIISIIIVGILNYILLKFNFTYIKPYLMHIISYLLLLFIYRENLIKTLIVFIFIFSISFLSEFLFGAIFGLTLNINFEIANQNFVYLILSNICIFIITFLLCKRKILNHFLYNMLNWYNKNEYLSLIIFTFCIVTISIFILYNNFINILPKSLLWLTNLFCVAVFVFVVGFFKEKTNKNKIIYEYDQLLDYVKTYEKLLDEKSKNQHEYKNQLAVIRVMVKDKKTLDYIDSLLNNETEENLETLNKLMYIPKGGLKGLIYYKIETMKKKKINIYVNISSELNKHSLWKKCDDNLESITKVLGVYLDNAIEASENTKDKIITFDVYLDNKDIVFEISNSFSNEINIEKIDNEGYSTKGTGKGYGLSLVKDIINKNSFLEQSREINGQFYIQKFYVKNKV